MIVRLEAAPKSGRMATLPSCGDFCDCGIKKAVVQMVQKGLCHGLATKDSVRGAVDYRRKLQSL